MSLYPISVKTALFPDLEPIDMRRNVELDHYAGCMGTKDMCSTSPPSRMMHTFMIGWVIWITPMDFFIPF